MWPFVTCFTKGFLKKSLTYFITEEESIIKVCLTVALNPMAFFFLKKNLSLWAGKTDFARCRDLHLSATCMKTLKKRKKKYASKREI